MREARSRSALSRVMRWESPGRIGLAGGMYPCKSRLGCMDGGAVLQSQACWSAACCSQAPGGNSSGDMGILRDDAMLSDVFHLLHVAACI